MLKKIIRDILIVAGVVTLYISTSRTAMQYLCNIRDNDKWWGMNQMNRGDLASISYLDFKYAREQEPPFPKPTYAGIRKVGLFLYGDSYIRDFPDTVFCGINKFSSGRYSGGLKYHLDTTQKNILIFEFTEREVRKYFSNIQVFNEVYDPAKRNKISTNLEPGAKYSVTKTQNQFATMFSDFHLENLFNKYINQNLECNLFNYNFIMPMFQTKAKLNYYLFNRASGDVVISKNKQFLFFKPTVTPSGLGSSYYPIQPRELAEIVANLNNIYDHYKADGFYEVYLSVIPNPATIMQPENYNNLIPLIQDNPQLKIKTIDMYSIFKDTSKLYYYAGDIHWNNNGKQAWLKIINKILEDMNSGITN